MPILKEFKKCFTVYLLFLVNPLSLRDKKPVLFILRKQII